MAYRNRTVPDSDKDVRRFLYNFSHQIAADPAAYGFDGATAAMLVALADEFITKSIIATRPVTRTSPAVRAKDDAKRRVLAVFREYVKKVRANLADDESAPGKLAGLGIVKEGRVRKSALPPPVMPPTLWIRVAMNGIHELGYWTTDAMTRRGKPRGASHLILLCHVGERPIGDPALARYVGAFTRWPMRVHHKPSEAGLCATYFAAWLTPSGEQTPWSPGVSMNIAFANVVHTHPGSAPAPGSAAGPAAPTRLKTTKLLNAA